MGIPYGWATVPTRLHDKNPGPLISRKRIIEKLKIFPFNSNYKITVILNLVCRKNKNEQKKETVTAEDA